MCWTIKIRERESFGHSRHLVMWEPKKRNLKINFKVILFGNYVFGWISLHEMNQENERNLTVQESLSYLQ
jgi:hypothetical protein